MGKAWYASKTIWANVVAFAATVGTIAGVDTGLTPEVQAEVVAAVMAVVNVALRLVTGEPIQ